MFYYIENKESSPFYNLALEQAVFDRLDKQRCYCMLWQNQSSVIVGKHQNTAAEINAPFVDSRMISVTRRLSGGGALYHDFGNINFTFISDNHGENKWGIDFPFFCKPVQEALKSFGVPAVISGRNDMIVDGKKISCNAQYIRHGRVMHHGTLLYDTDLAVLTQALNPGCSVTSKAIKSVQSRVANIKPYMKDDMSVEEFRAALRERLFTAFDMREYTLSDEDKAVAKTLCDQVYSQWSWNYGASPAYNVRKIRRVEGCGTVEALLDIAKGGVIGNIAFYGDFFSHDDPAILAAALIGLRLERAEISGVLYSVNVSRFFHNMDSRELLALLFE